MKDVRKKFDRKGNSPKYGRNGIENQQNNFISFPCVFRLHHLHRLFHSLFNVFALLARSFFFISVTSRCCPLFFFFFLCRPNVRVQFFRLRLHNPSPSMTITYSVFLLAAFIQLLEISIVFHSFRLRSVLSFRTVAERFTCRSQFRPKLCTLVMCMHNKAEASIGKLLKKIRSTGGYASTNQHTGSDASNGSNAEHTQMITLKQSTHTLYRPKRRMYGGEAVRGEKRRGNLLRSFFSLSFLCVCRVCCVLRVLDVLRQTTLHYYCDMRILYL